MRQDSYKGQKVFSLFTRISSFLQKFGLEPTAIYMTDYKPTSVETEDLYRKKIGDWLYGQRIIEAFITLIFQMS